MSYLDPEDLIGQLQAVRGGVDKIENGSDPAAFLAAMRRWLNGGAALRRDELPLERRWCLRGGPDSPSPELTMESFMVRATWIHSFGFPVVIDETIDGLLPFGPFVEVGAGTGFLSRLLALAGGDSIATDAGTGEYGFSHGAWREIQVLDGAAAVRAYPDRTVLMSWPSLGDSWCEEVVAAMRPGGLLAHIGERGGCTGTEAFDEMLSDRFEPVARVALPVFGGLHDRLDVLRRLG